MKRLFIILIVLFFGCQTTGPVGMTKEQVSADETAIKELVQQLSVTYNENDFKGYCSLWADGSKFITRNGKSYIIKRADDEKRIERNIKSKESVGTSKHKFVNVKLISPTEATGTSEYSCSVCNKGKVGKAHVRFKFIKQDGKWLVLLRDMETK